MIEINGDSGDLKKGLVSLAYILVYYKYTTWSIPEEEVARLINKAVGYEVATVYSS